MFMNGRESDKPELLYITCVSWKQNPQYIMMHKHEHQAEITLVISGNGKYSINHHIYDVKEGDVILCGVGVVHDAFMRKQEHYDTLTMRIGNLQMEGREPGQFLAKGEIPVFHQPPSYQDCLQLFQQAIREMDDSFTDISSYGAHSWGNGHRDDAAAGTEPGHSSMREVLDIVREMTDRDSGMVQHEDSFCLEIEEYISLHYREPVSLETIAAAFYLSPYYLSHLFKLETGYNFKQYLTRMRIGEAQKLLDESDIRISEIAGKVGYEDPAYFSKSFFRETGMTPREYRTYIRV